MSPSTFVVTWVLQSTVLGLVAVLLPVLVRLRDPGALVSWWGSSAGLVVLLPLLPLLSPRPPASSAVMAFVDQATVVMGPALASPPLLSPAAWLACLWAAGVATRLAWLVAGHRRLRRLAACGVPVENDPALDHARLLAPVAALPPLAPTSVPVVSFANAGPCAFGWMNVCVLVPVALRERPDAERLAVYLHELTHIARADLIRGYADEAWRLVWWWQPGVWIALAQLRLAREHEVDALVVTRTGGTRAYVEALLWCSTLQPAGVPSMPVGSRRHALVRRVSLMCEGTQMSQTRRWVTAAAMLLMLGAVSGGVSTVSPLRAATMFGMQDGMAGPSEPGLLESQALLPTLDAPAPRRVVSVEPVWGPSPFGFRFRVHVIVDASGRVAEARIPQVVPAGTPDGESRNAWTSARAAVLDAVRQWQFEVPPAAPMLLMTDVVVGNVASTATAARQRATSSSRAPDALRVGGAVGPPKKVVDLPPLYPDVAKEAGVSGVVIMEITVDREGLVADAQILRSIPLLDGAALAAVKQWRYEPTLLNGQPVPVIMTVTINFTLQ